MTDKCCYDGKIGHSYVQNFYEAAFAPYREKTGIRLLEIGVREGDSLRLWHEVFCESSFVVGIDIDDQYFDKIWRDTSGRVYLCKEDAYNIDLMSSLAYYDIIIDDGPHTFESQVFAIKHYLSKINEGGLFVIEDLVAEERYKPYYIDLCRQMLQLVDSTMYSASLLDLRSKIGREDDVLLVVERLNKG